VTWIDGTGYVVSPLDGVNGVRRNLLAARIQHKARRESFREADMVLYVAKCGVRRFGR
jgi:hypothetical protein